MQNKNKIEENVRVINALIDEMESEDFDFVKKINEELKKKCFMWTLCEYSFLPAFIRDKYTLDILKLATLWSLSEDEEISEWAKHCEKNGVILNSFQFMKTFGTYVFFLEMGKGMRDGFTKMLDNNESFD